MGRSNISDLKIKYEIEGNCNKCGNCCREIRSDGLKNEKELKQITHEQLQWLLSGLQICPKSYFEDIEMTNDKIAI